MTNILADRIQLEIMQAKKLDRVLTKKNYSHAGGRYKLHLGVLTAPQAEELREGKVVEEEFASSAAMRRHEMQRRLGRRRSAYKNAIDSSESSLARR
jgi:hypothetical protein